MSYKCSCTPSNKCRRAQTKIIHVYLNGRKNNRYKVTLDAKRRQHWHQILNEITSRIHPYFGVVKKLYSADSGCTICSFSDLDNNGTYVASDSKDFQIIKGGYRNDDDDRTIFEHYFSCQLNRANRQKKLTFVRRDLLVIYVYLNGIDKDPPTKFVLSQEDLKCWEQTLSFIALVIDMPYRTIKALYSANGNKICGPWELQHGASYIAVGYHERFCHKNYKIVESSTEVWRDRLPLVPKNKLEKCAHMHDNKYELPRWRRKLSFRHSSDTLYTASHHYTGGSKRPRTAIKQKCRCNTQAPSRRASQCLLSNCICDYTAKGKRNASHVYSTKPTVHFTCTC